MNVKIKCVNNVVSEYHGKVGKLGENKQEPITHRERATHFEPIVIGHRTLFQVTFAEEGLPTNPLWLPKDCFEEVP